MESIHVAASPSADVASDSSSRRALLARALLAGGTVAAGGVLVAGLPGIATSAPSASQDAQILDFALLLERLQKAFYDGAAGSPAATGGLREFVRVVSQHEAQHVAILEKALGSAASAPPTVSFGDVFATPARFTAAAAMLEDLGVAAYNGQAANLTPRSLAAAAEIISVDARHAAWIRSIAGKPPADEPTDTPLAADQVKARIAQTGWVA